MLEITTYFICIIIVYYSLKRQYRIITDNGIVTRDYTISWLSILLFTLLIVFVNYIYTNLLGLDVEGDRIHYRAGFNNNDSPSLGLLFIYALGKLLNLDFANFSLLITVLSVPLVFIAYKLAKSSTPLMVLFFLCTPYIINGFDNFKQTFTNGFACLIFAILTRKQSIWTDIASIIFIILASIFHPTGFILIIFFILYKVNLKINNYWSIFLLLFIVIILLKPLLLWIASILGSFVPFLTDKIHQYFDEDTLQSEGRMIVALKGLVYFFIAFHVICHKNKLKKIVPDFSFNYIVCMFACFLYLLSYYNVWMSRMVELFIFPIMMFWAKCIRSLPNKQFNKVMTCILTGFFTLRLMWLSVVNPPH